MTFAERKLTHIEGLIEACEAVGEDRVPTERIRLILEMENEVGDEVENLSCDSV